MATSQQDSAASNSASSDVQQSSLGTEVQADTQAVGGIFDLSWRVGQQVTQAVGDVVASKRERKSLAQAQRSYLGPWTELAYYDGKSTKLPVLNTKKFQDYMVETDGRFRPEKSCTAHAEWAQFVNALGIRPNLEPEQNVLSWKSPPPKSDRPTSHDQSLEIDGEVLCHIVNLFNEEQLTLGRPKPIVPVGEQDSVRTTFARIAWDSAGDPTSARFQLEEDETISADRLPFGSVGRLMREGDLIGNYFKCLYWTDDGCSDSRFSWPDPQKPLYERIQDLHLNLLMIQENSQRNLYNNYLSSMRYARQYRDGTSNRTFEEYLEKEEFERFSYVEGAKRLAQLYSQRQRWDVGQQVPVLITSKWLGHANRIWRRATSQTGSDRRFLDDILSTLDTSPELQRRRARYSNPRNFDEEIEDAKKQVRSACMFDGDAGFELNLLMPSFAPERMSSPPSHRPLTPWKTVGEVLERYKDEKNDQWKQDLYVARSEILWLMKRKKDIICDAHRVRYLHFRPDDLESPLWKEKGCQLIPAANNIVVARDVRQEQGRYLPNSISISRPF